MWPRDINNIRINTLRPRQNGRYFPDDIFKLIILNKISLKFVPRGPIDNQAALDKVMAWRRTGDKPLPETILAHFTDACMRH